MCGVKINYKKIILTITLLVLLTIGAASATNTNNASLNSADLTDESLKHTIIDKKIYDTQNKVNEYNQANTNPITNKDNKIMQTTNNSKEANTIKDTSKNNYKNKESNTPQTNTKKSFTDLNNNITNSPNSITLYNNYEFKEDTDTNLNNEITINKTNFTINGNYKTIDAKNINFKIRITGGNITINNLIFKNGIKFRINDANIITNNVTFENCTDNNYGALVFSRSTYISNNDKFIDNQGPKGASIASQNSEITINNGLFENKNNIQWSLIYALKSKLKITNTNFTNMTSQYATAIYADTCESYINNSRFINLFANKTAGAIAFRESTNLKIENCEFINVSSNKNSGAIFIDINGMSRGAGTVIINNTLFSNCSSGFGGAYLQLGGNLAIIDSNFTNNYAKFNGGAIYLSDTETEIENSKFSYNEVSLINDYHTYGGAIFFDNGYLYLYDSKFINNTAYQGSGLYSYDSYYQLSNLTFTNNSNPAIYTFFDKEGSMKEDIKGIIINPNDFNNTYYPSVISGEGIPVTLINNTVPLEIPDYYDLRELNLTTPIKNQGNMGACWVFAMNAALESAILKSLNITTDLSENNMQNTMIQYSRYGFNYLIEGGNNILAMTYLLNWFGAFSEEYDTYDELGKISPIIQTNNDIHIQDILLIDNTPLNETNNNIKNLDNVKEAILRYGALSSTLSYDAKKYYNPKTYAEYATSSSGTGHGICVVGWDDNYPASNFLNNCPGDGAWIVKNSYGTTWGDEGYFYVSYYDQTLRRPTAIIIENTIQYNKNYQYDLTGMSYFNNTCKKYLNIFESIDDDVIAAVGTYFFKERVDYTVEIIVNNISIYNQTGISPYYGYYTIKLDKYIPIKKGDKFNVKITSNMAPLCRESRLHFENGKSFAYDAYSEEWVDLNNQNQTACIKVYTLPQLIKTENLKIITGEELFTVNVNQSNVNVVIAINNNTLSEITDEKGITKFNLSYLEDGNYTITTTYNGTSVINLVEVKNLNRLIEKLQETNNKQKQTINEQEQNLNKTKEELQKTQTQIKTLNNTINTLKKQIENLKQQQKTTTKTTTKITAKPKTYKAKTKIKKYTITLKTKKGNLLTKVTVYLTIKGKKYKKTLKTKTNSKGKATFKIKKLNKKGKYTARIKFKGTKKYKASKKTVKIIIK